MLLYLKELQHIDAPKQGDECGKCIDRLCCVVYKICDTGSEYGDDGVIKKGSIINIKKGGLRCENLGDTGECGIYKNRGEYPGYRKSCESYTCNNVGPILNAWLRLHKINITQNSSIISIVLDKLTLFLATREGYSERILFLEKYLFPQYSNIYDLNTWLSKNANEQQFIFRQYVYTELKK